MNKLLLIQIIFYSSILLGCAYSRQISGPNGETLYSIDCSGYALNMGSCLEKAGKICGSAGYDILMGGTSNHGNAATYGQYGFFSSPIISREIIIQCKKNNALN